MLDRRWVGASILVVVIACGGSVANDPNDAGEPSDAGAKDVTAADVPIPFDAPADVVAPPVTGTPPPKPSGPPTASSSRKTYAIRTLYLGETTRAGVQSNAAWKEFGFNLDGKVTVGTSTDVCTRTKGAPSSNQVDGAQGIDNAFGATLLPLIMSASSTVSPSKVASAEYQTGKRTLELSIVGLDGTNNQTATGLGGGLFPALDYSGDGPVVPFPGFTAGTDWPVRVEGLADGVTIAGGAKASLVGSWINGGVFVSGGPSMDVALDLPLAGAGLPLLVHHAVVTLDAAGHGTLAGIADTEEFILALRKVAGRISTTLCGSQFDGIAQQIRQISDILKDGTNVAGLACDGFSVGIGFDAEPIANPTKVAKAPLPTPPDPCQ